MDNQKKTAIFYSFNSQKSAKIGEKIASLIGLEHIDIVNVESTTKAEMQKYENLILGVPTWFDGELPNYWDELLPDLESAELSGKKVAIYGLGDQKNYPENFCDGVGLMCEFMAQKGAIIVGKTAREGYTYEASKAEKDGVFLGLLLDQENQAKLSDKRIADWVKELRIIFNL